MIRSFEIYGELIPLAQGNQLTLTLSTEPATVAEALTLLGRQYPALQSRLSHCAVVCGTDVLLRTSPLPMTGQLALLPPVAGG